MLVSLTTAVVVLRLCKGVIDSLKPVLLRQLDLVDKATTIAAAQDVSAYQGLQVMNTHTVGYDGDSYDPSDAAEARREAERNNENFEELSDAEHEELRSAF